jgi:hypothetical protein
MSLAYISSGWPDLSLEMSTYTISKLTNSPGFASKLLYSSKMPAFTLYGSRGSTHTDRVRLTLAEGGFTDYELVLLNLQKGEQKVGDPFLLEDDAASPCVSELYILSSFEISSHSSNICSLAYNIQFSWELTQLHPVQRTRETSPVG